jgi:chromate transporter
MPGPNSTELAIHIGFQRARWAGLLLAGLCFILPAALMVGAIAWAYVRFGHLPQVAGILYGVKPVIIAVVAQALWGLGRTALKTRERMAVGLLAALCAFGGVDELVLLFGAGALAGGIQWIRQPQHSVKPLLLFVSAALVLVAAPFLFHRYVTVASTFGLWPLFLFFAKVGSVLYGSGYVLLAFLRNDLVIRWRWLTSAQLLDAVAVGQVTPGPVFTTATFIGYVLAGPKGAVAATVGIFLPAFIFVALSGPLVPRIRRSPLAGAFLDGVNVASLALMAVVTWQLARDSLTSPFALLLAAMSAVLLLRYRVNSAWLLLGAAILGLLLGR